MRTVQDLLAGAARTIADMPDTIGYLGVVTTIRALAKKHDVPDVGDEALRALHRHLGYPVQSHLALDLARWSRIRTVATVVDELERAAEAAARPALAGGDR